MCNVKGNHTSLEALGPARANQVSEKKTSIFSRSLSNAIELVRMKDTMLDSIKLKSPSNYLLNELAEGVEQDNGSKGLRSVIGQFTRLRNNNKDRLLEVSRLVSQGDTKVDEGKNARGTDIVS